MDNVSIILKGSTCSFIFESDSYSYSGKHMNLQYAEGTFSVTCCKREEPKLTHTEIVFGNHDWVAEVVLSNYDFLFLFSTYLYFFHLT